MMLDPGFGGVPFNAELPGSHRLELRLAEPLMAVKVERAEKGDPEGDKAVADHLEYFFRHQLLVSGKVEIVDFQSLPRTERKSKRVFDKRK